MASIYHPFDTEALYQADENGNIRVTKGNSVGVFTREGVHLEGEDELDTGGKRDMSFAFVTAERGGPQRQHGA